MVLVQNAVEIEVWSVEKLVNAVASTGNNSITIPPYQRRLVWNQSKRKELINSIKHGYPFGSILLYEDIKRGQEAGDGKHYFSLIDGLQRTQALMDFVQRQNGYFTRADLDDDFIDLVARHLRKETDEYRDRIRATIVEWVKGRRSFDAASGWSDSNLTRTLIEKVLRTPSNSLLLQQMFFELSSDVEFNRALGNFLDETSNEVKVILDAKIPVLRYEGDAAELPKIFELINTQGKALTRYEVFAARWIDTRQPVANQLIIDAIWKNYDALAEEGFSLDAIEDAPDPDSRKTREYSLYEYLNGFGTLLSKKFPRLFKSTRDDQPSSASFNLMTACVNMRVQDMDKLDKTMVDLDWGRLETCVLEAVKFVNDVLFPVLGPVRAGKNRPLYHSELMIVAFIATVFNARYTIRDLQENDSWKRDKRRLKTNLPMFYLSEILHDDWRGSGDNKLNERVRYYRYLNTEPPTEERWNQILDDWYAEHLVERSDRKQYISDKRTEFLLLRYIFADLLGPNANYHVEHVIPTEQLLPLKPKNEGWLYNSIGNLALIKSAGELKYNKETYIEILRKRLHYEKISRSEYQQQCADFSQQLICPPEDFPTSLTAQAYEQFLLKRWERLKETFFHRYRNFITTPTSPSSAR